MWVSTPVDVFAVCWCRPLAMADGDQKPRSYKSKASDSYFAKALPR